MVATGRSCRKREALRESFDLERYIERPTGPFGTGRVTVKCLARRQ
jgi:hypothetical protein